MNIYGGPRVDSLRTAFRYLLALTFVFIAGMATGYAVSQIYQQIQSGVTVLVREQGEISCGQTITANTVLTSDVLSCGTHGLIIGAAGIELDCQRHILTGVGHSSGVLVENKQNVTIRNCSIEGFWSGISISYSADATVLTSSVTNSRESGIDVALSTDIHIFDSIVADGDFSGIRVFASTNISMTGNRVSNHESGLIISHSTNVTLLENSFTSDGVRLDGNSSPHFESHAISPTNTVNGRPLYYYKDCADVALKGISLGQLIVVNCRNVEVAHLEISDTDIGIVLRSVENALVHENRLENNGVGLFLPGSTNVTVANNRLDKNGQGLNFYYSTSSTASNNQISNNGYGISDIGSNLTIVGNMLSGNGHAISFTQSSDLTINGNVVSNNSHGIELFFSDRILISNNSISGNLAGLELSDTSKVLVRHNNIVGNALQASDSESSSNSWDDGYPSGGNFWSDYTGIDNCSGPGQDVCPDPDGIGDTPHVVGSPPIMDGYPLIGPFDSSEVIAHLVPPEGGVAYMTEPVGFTIRIGGGSPPYSCLIDWGDHSGRFSAPCDDGQVVIHSFPSRPSEGTYTVSLTITDNDGAVDTYTQPVTVQPEPRFMGSRVSWKHHLAPGETQVFRARIRNPSEYTVVVTVIIDIFLADNTHDLAQGTFLLGPGGSNNNAIITYDRATLGGYCFTATLVYQADINGDGTFDISGLGPNSKSGCGRGSG